MSQKPFFKRTPVKIVLVTLSFLLMLFLGGIPITIVMVMDQELWIRFLIALSGVVWAGFTIPCIWFFTDYSRLWKSWRSERKGEEMRRVRELYPEYMALRSKYPLAIARHERHCMHQKPPIRYEQMIEMALEVDEKEWAEREEFRRANREERRAARAQRASASGSLR